MPPFLLLSNITEQSLHLEGLVEWSGLGRVRKCEKWCASGLYYEKSAGFTFKWGLLLNGGGV